MISIIFNGWEQSYDVESDMPLLWFILKGAGFCGTKFVCGITQCGAFTVNVERQAVRSCMYPAVAVVASK